MEKSGAKKEAKKEPEPKINNFGSATLVKIVKVLNLDSTQDTKRANTVPLES